MESTLSIGELAAATGLSAKTIRYYEEMGVLPAPRRTATGYRRYARADVHRALFVRRARALGFPLSRLRALRAELDGQPSRAMRPRLQQLVTDHLGALREQIADLRVLERQLEQVLQRLRAGRSAAPSAACRCLEDPAGAGSRPGPSRPLTSRGGEGEASRDATMEAITRLGGAGTRDCGCGCTCAGEGAVPMTPGLVGLPRRVIAPARADALRRVWPARTVDTRRLRG